jgi:ABC-type nitrate/sulfonate/bicarbonate transport system permease component
MFKAYSERVYSALSFAAFLALWEVLARAGILDDRFFPEPTRIFVAGCASCWVFF